MKIYEVVTEYRARFTYWVAAESPGEAGEAADALMMAELQLNDEIDYEIGEHEVEEADDGHGHVFDAKAINDADEAGVENIWHEAYRG